MQPLGVGDLARRWKVTRTSVWVWTGRADFPEPDGRTSGRRWWRESTIEAWEAGRRESGLPLPKERGYGGRPPNKAQMEA